MNERELRQAYAACFDTPTGKVVLKDLHRVANLTRINSDDPNSNAALFKIAQQDLVRRIERMSHGREEEA